MSRQPSLQFVCTVLLLLASVLVGTKAQAQSHFVRLGDGLSEAASRIAVAELGDGRVVTAVTDSAGDLKLTVWDVQSDGKVTKRGSIGAGATSVFALATLGTGDAITAVKQENGNLRLIDWAIDKDGKITRRGKIDAGPIDRVSIRAAGPSRVATATVAGADVKLIVWDLSGKGEFTRRGDAQGGKAVRADLATLSAEQLVLASKGPSGKLRLSSWSLNQAGTLAAQQSTFGSSIKEVNVVNTALDRAVTACQLLDGTLEVAAWDVDAAGNFTAGGSAKAGKADSIALRALGSTKVVTPLRADDGTFKLISWKVVQAVQRLDSISAGKVGAVSAATLGWDRVVTAIQDADNKLKLIAYADVSMGLLEAGWGPNLTIKKGGLAGGPLTPPEVTKLHPVDDRGLMPTQRGLLPRPKVRPSRGSESAEGAVLIRGLPTRTPRPGPPPPTPLQSPKPELVFHPSISGVDPMIAVGKQFVIVTQDHWIEFLHKTGPKAGEQLDPKPNAATKMSASEFFRGFFEPKKADGSVNRNNINLHGRFPPSFDSAVRCNATTANPPLPCMNEAYDTRVIYDPHRGRFVIMSAIRGSGLSGATALVARRYVAIAVSKTEDPRDGFIQYATTESNYSDWPRIASSAGALVVAHNACKGPENDDICGSDHQNVPGNAMALRPLATVYDIDDMIKRDPAPRSFKIYPYQVGGGTFYPVAHHGNSASFTYLVRPTSGLEIYRFKTPTDDWSKVPTLEKSAVTLEGGASGFREAVHFQNGQLYLGSTVSVADRVPNTSPERWHVRAVRIPVSGSQGALVAGPCPGTSGCLDVSFGLHALEDAPEDELSYELPSLVPDRDGNMLLVYGRVPVTMANPIGQEARFSIYYSDARGLARSRLIQAGDTILKAIHCKSKTAETTAVAENYHHVWYGDDVCSSQPHFQDYGTAAIDPDGTAFWVVHAHADSASGKFKMVGAKIVP